MAEEVVQKEFQGGSLRPVCTLGVLAIAAVCIWQGGIGQVGQKHLDPQLFADPPVVATTPCVPVVREESIKRSIRESDLYVVAGRNIAEGTMLMPQDLKVVRMPGLRG